MYRYAVCVKMNKLQTTQQIIPSHLWESPLSQKAIVCVFDLRSLLDYTWGLLYVHLKHLMCVFQGWSSHMPCAVIWALRTVLINLIFPWTVLQLAEALSDHRSIGYFSVSCLWLCAVMSNTYDMFGAGLSLSESLWWAALALWECIGKATCTLWTVTFQRPFRQFNGL